MALDMPLQMNLFSSLDLALCVLSAYVGFRHLILYLNRRSSTEHLQFSLLCFAIALNDLACVGLYNSQSIPSGEVWQQAQFFCSVAISAGFVTFTYCLIGRKSDLIKRTLLVLLGLLFIGGASNSALVLDPQSPMERTMTAFGATVTYFEHKPGILWNLLFLVQTIGMCWLYGVLIVAFVRNKKRDLLPLLGGFFAFFVSAVVDMLISMDVILSLYTIEYVFLVMILVMDYILIKRSIAAFEEVETLNLHLGEKVEERTLEIRMLADELKVANKQLEEKNVSLKVRVERDEMTALLNHAAFHSRFAEMFNLCRRQRFPVSVMLLDIDHFKQINDSLGHQAGDLVIIRFAGALRDSFRNYDLKSRYQKEASTTVTEFQDYDITGRYGGDEFAIALPNCGEQEARSIAERICSRIRSLAFATNVDLRVTSSIGCAVVLDPSTCESELQLIQLADQALYGAKEAGRDRFSISVWPRPAPDGESD
jgi:GGDEF domain-containing protein